MIYDPDIKDEAPVSDFQFLELVPRLYKLLITGNRCWVVVRFYREHIVISSHGYDHSPVWEERQRGTLEMMLRTWRPGVKILFERKTSYEELNWWDSK